MSKLQQHQQDEHATQHNTTLGHSSIIDPHAALNELDRRPRPHVWNGELIAWPVLFGLAVLAGIASPDVRQLVERFTTAPTPAVTVATPRPALFDCSRIKRNGDDFEIRMLERKTMFIIHCKDAGKGGAS